MSKPIVTKNGNEDSKILPITLKLSVISFNRVSIPSHLSFIETGDTIIGTVEHELLPSPQYLNKQLSSNRTITLGFLKKQFPGKKLPENITITIREVIKKKESLPTVNVLGYIRNQDKLIYFDKSELSSSSIKKLKDKAMNSVEILYTRKDNMSYTILQGDYFKDLDLWVVPIIFYLQGDFGLVPTSLLLLFDKVNYTKFSSVQDKANLLIERYVTWLSFEEDLNEETIKLFALQLTHIIETKTLPTFYGLQEILTMEDELKKRILIICIKNRKKNGITLEELFEHLESYSEEVVKSKVEQLEKENLLLLLDKKTESYDISWLL
ncbi:MAG: hypothetical protein ACTSRR_03235 [Candidatus Heimdallarchaeaceae archaeon]